MDISTEIYHLQELSRYEAEKPFTMRYVPEGTIPASNVVREKRTVAVEDMRGRESRYSLEKNGFMISNLSSKMTYGDYDSHNSITNIYIQELEGVLSKLFPGSNIDFVSYLIRKRDQSFPYSTGEQYSFGQPNIVAHIDATSGDLIRQIRKRHGQDAERILNNRSQYITIWKPLKGPLYDWPLALCDGNTVDAEKDLEPQDIVDRDEVLENVHVYHRPSHRWYYLSGQQDSELLIFRQADTMPGSFGRTIIWVKRPCARALANPSVTGTPHCAIANPKAPKGSIPRESIEVVAFVCDAK